MRKLAGIFLLIVMALGAVAGPKAKGRTPQAKPRGGISAPEAIRRLKLSGRSLVVVRHSGGTQFMVSLAEFRSVADGLSIIATRERAGSSTLTAAVTLNAQGGIVSAADPESCKLLLANNGGNCSVALRNRALAVVFPH